VLAHAESFSQGFCLFQAEQAVKTRWDERWDRPTNETLIKRIKEFGAKNGLTSQEAVLGWLLNRPFPTVALVSLPSLLAAKADFERASEFRFEFDNFGF